MSVARACSGFVGNEMGVHDERPQRRKAVSSVNRNTSYKPSSIPSSIILVLFIFIPIGTFIFVSSVYIMNGIYYSLCINVNRSDALPRCSLILSRSRPSNFNIHLLVQYNIFSNNSKVI